MSTTVNIGACACCSDQQCGTLLITYDWSGTGQNDLDTGTTFLGVKVGYSCGFSGPYISWGGDNTSVNATERVEIRWLQALIDNQWSGSVNVDLAAGWFIPAEGSGPCTVRVRCLEGGPEQSKTIYPGEQSSCASENVGYITIDDNGTFTLY
jgi:hypothetical protein